jgi:hypothetical protein
VFDEESYGYLTSKIEKHIHQYCTRKEGGHRTPGVPWLSPDDTRNSVVLWQVGTSMLAACISGRKPEQ